MTLPSAFHGPVLITGGAGFIGSHLARTLVDAGVEVRILDNLSSGHRENLAGITDDVEFIEGDIRSELVMDRAVSGVDSVFHMAAIASVPLSVADPRLTFDVNVSGMLNLLVAARDAGCRRVVFSSSCAIYGNTTSLPTPETITPSPMSPYATSKLNGEHLCTTFTDTYGLETVALRYFNVFGPGQDPDSPYAAALPRFLKDLLAGQACTIFGDGTQSRDFVFVDDVVAANIAAATAPGVAGEVFNVASGRQVSINDAVWEMARCLGVPALVTYADPRPGDLKHSCADVRAATRDLDFRARIPFEAGLEHLVAATVGSLVT